MKKTTPFIISFCFIFLFSLLSVRTAFAHGDDARIEISADRMNPGSTLDIRGVGFEPEEEIGLLLIGSQLDIPLGTVITDEEGGFLLTLTLPVDLVEGTYIVRGTTNDNHSVDSPQLTVWGTADPGSANGELREEDDGLLAAMPTIGPDVPTPMMSSAPTAGSSAQTKSPATPYGWIAAGIGVIAISTLALVWKKR